MKTWTFIDKTKWPERGPWDNEPDKAQWQDPTTGLVCLMVRARSNWCGYVGVPEGHPAFEKEPWDLGVPAHGGLNFGSFCQAPFPPDAELLAGCSNDPEARVCHTPEPGQPDRVWWLGFDCGHSHDKRPAIDPIEVELNEQFPLVFGNTYRDFDYVREQCTELAQALGEMTE